MANSMTQFYTFRALILTGIFVPCIFWVVWAIRITSEALQSSSKGPALGNSMQMIAGYLPFGKNGAWIIAGFSLASLIALWASVLFDEAQTGQMILGYVTLAFWVVSLTVLAAKHPPGWARSLPVFFTFFSATVLYFLNPPSCKTEEKGKEKTNE
jgi:hypothetical protein